MDLEIYFWLGGGVRFFITGMAKGGVKIPRKDHLLPLLSYFILIFSPHFLKKLLSSLFHIPFLPSLPHNFSNFPHSFPYNWPQFSSIFSSLFLNISSYYVLNNVENWDLRTFVVIGLTFGFMSILRKFMPWGKLCLFPTPHLGTMRLADLSKHTIHFRLLVGAKKQLLLLNNPNDNDIQHLNW